MLQITDQQLQDAIAVLNKGGVIIFPTETSYGIGCDATNATAVRRIFEIKGRPAGKGLPVLIPAKEDAFSFIDVNETIAQLAEKYWPGDLNIVAPVVAESPIVAECRQDDMQSVRVSSHPIASTLVRRFGKPVVATSANLSGEAALYDIKDVRRMFKDRSVDFIIDGGMLAPRPASTTVRVRGQDIEILRQGAIVL